MPAKREPFGRHDLRRRSGTGGMFARAVPGRRRSTGFLLAALLAAVAGGCGGESQDANEAEGSFQLEVADASFPARQTIAERSTMRIEVRNAGNEDAPNVAVTVETEGASPDAGPVAFAQSRSDPRLADPNRPVWVLDEEPRGGSSAYSNTWTLGPLPAGKTKTFEWKLTAVEPGDYALSYRVAPGLDGKAQLAEGSKADGTFDVSISDEPVPARVNDDGEVVRGEEAGAGSD
jgi:hypothetical protein